MSMTWNELKKQPNKEVYEPIETVKPTQKYVGELPDGSISFDLESYGVEEMWQRGPEYIRLVGWHTQPGTEVKVTKTAHELVDQIRNSDGWVIGHNVYGFDLILLDKHHGLSVLELTKAGRVRDTKLLAFLADPPFSRTKQFEIEKKYGLQQTGIDYLGEGKMTDVITGGSVLKSLAKEYGGFGEIPQDHPQYIEYLIKDVEVTRDLCSVLPINDYALREHTVAAVCATISIQGFRVDEKLLRERILQGEQKREQILTSLMEYGLPAPDSSAAPHRTNAGINAIDKAFASLGVTLPRTATGRPALGKDVLNEIAEESVKPEVHDLTEAILGLNGIRTIYGNILDNLVGDKVHPSINLRQSTGRLSIQNPGLTVIGKRGGKVIEREVFLPDDEDSVLISADLSQVDARAVAALSQDLEYMKLFEKGRDMHAEMAVRLFGDAARREDAKAAVHGINYGMRAKKLALTTGMTQFESQDVISNFEASFPRLVNWQQEMREIGEMEGVLYNGFGRMMRIEAERAFTQSPALMGQSTARDILMEGILNLWKVGGEQAIRQIRGIVHDELVLSVKAEDAEEFGLMVVDAMTFDWCPQGGEHAIKIEAGIAKPGKNWARCYDK